MRGKDGVLTSKVQHKLLRERATEMVDEWDFPESDAFVILPMALVTNC